MRQRKVKNEAEKLAQVVQITDEAALQQKGRWYQFFGGSDAAEGEKARSLYLELGCGKGRFLMQQAMLHPDRNYIGIEGRGSVVLRAMEKARESGLTNIHFIQIYVKEIRDYFAEGELAGIYLNFSDPWPKGKHAKRRLTHRGYLAGYWTVLAPGGCLEIKTDNPALFAFTMEEFEAVDTGFQIVFATEDLHGTEDPARLVTTEYEEKFKAMGKPIYYIRARKVDQ